MQTIERAILGAAIGGFIGATINNIRLLRANKDANQATEELAEAFVELRDEFVQTNTDLTMMTRKADQLIFQAVFFADKLRENGIELSDFEKITISDPPGFFENKFNLGELDV